MKARAFLSAIFILVLMCSFSYADTLTCPAAVPITGISTPGTAMPQGVAIDNTTGTVYISDFLNNQVLIYSRGGFNAITPGLPGTLTNNGKGPAGIGPTAIAVDSSSGRIYIGSAIDQPGGDTGLVGVYDANYNLLYTLGTGWGEFQYPAGIAFDANNIYVADSRSNFVSIYNKLSGQFISKFGGTNIPTAAPPAGSVAPGSLFGPSAITVSPITGNLLIVDHAMWWNPAGGQSYTGAWVQGAALNEFTPAGVFVAQTGSSCRVAGAYGSTLTSSCSATPGIMFSPAGIAADAAGRIFVSDTVANTFQVFGDSIVNGVSALAPLCMIQNSVSMPKGLAYSGAGALYAVSATGVAQLGIDNYVTMDVSPTSVAYSGQLCGSSPLSQSVTITNNGKGALNWSITPGPDAWLTETSSSSSTLAAGQSAVVSALVNAAGMSAGTYNSSFKVSSQAGVQPVSATLSVGGAPAFSISPAALNFTYSGAQPLNPQQLNVDLTGDATNSVTWTISSDSPWLTANPSSGSSDTLTGVSVGADPGQTGNLTGTYKGNLTVSPSCSQVTSQKVPVTLSYTAGGTITVTTNEPLAPYTVIGPATYGWTGTACTAGGTSSTAGSCTWYAVPAGSYTVTFTGMPGFITPVSQTSGIIKATKDLWTANGQYVDLRKRDEIASIQDDKAMLGTVTISNGTTGAGMGTVSIVSSQYKVVSLASGDVEGSGLDQIITSSDSLVNNSKGVIQASRADGTSIFVPFKAFTNNYSANIAAGDLYKDGNIEIVAAPASQSTAPAVKIFKYDRVSKQVLDTGVTFTPYAASTNIHGVRLAVADVDGDGQAEIITIPSVDTGSLQVAVWKLSGTGVTQLARFNVNTKALRTDGKVTAILPPAVTGGDVSASGTSQIILAVPRNSMTGLYRVLVYDSTGTQRNYFDVTSMGGINLAAGDVNYDGQAEVVIGQGPYVGNTGLISVYNGAGKPVVPPGSFSPYTKYGASIILGVFK